MKSVKILSIDGGGVYGIMSAMILAELEALTGKRIAELFDVIAGTSTGGIIALGLTIPDRSGRKAKYTAQDAVELYESHSKDIFSRSLWHEIISVGNLLGVKYPATGIERILHHFFDDAKLSESVTNVLIPSYEVESRMPYFFKSHKAKQENGMDFLVRDAARATSAAPSYFPAAKIQDINKLQTFVLIDGGVVANDPAMCAYAEGKAMYPECADFNLLSISSANTNKPYQYEKVKNWGAAEWMEPVLSIFSDGISETVDYELKHIFMANSSEKNQYDRLAIPNSDTSIGFDDSRDSSIRILKEYAQSYIDGNTQLLEKIAKQLTD